MYPSARVDGAAYRGRFTGEKLFETICSTSVPELCDDFVDPNLSYLSKVPRVSNYWTTYCKTFLILIIILYFIFYFWKRKVKQEMHDKMEVKINDVLSHYASMNKNEFFDATELEDQFLKVNDDL